MIQQNIINEVTDRLVTVYHPLEIYIFGSYAWGTPTPDSDLDLLIVVEHSSEKKHKRGIKGSLSLYGLGLSKDIVVFTKDEFDQRVNDVTTLCYKVKKEGKVLYAESPTLLSLQSTLEEWDSQRDHEDFQDL